jgi:hypothetical protein
MKKSRFFLAAGTLVLAVTAVFAGKANRKYVGFTTAVVGTFAVNAVVPAGLLTTSHTSNSNYRVYVTIYDGTHHIDGDLKSAAGNPIFYIQ